MDAAATVTIPVEPETAALADARNRAAVRRLVSRMLCPHSGPSAPPWGHCRVESRRGSGWPEPRVY